MIENEGFPEKYLQGIECFNKGDYFQCHELLESLWLEVGGTRGIFYQALIQEAVAIYHLENKNLFGAKSLFSLGLEKLIKIPDTFMGVGVRILEKDLKEFFEPYLSLEQGQPFGLERSRIPKICVNRF